ncbi:MAG: alpha/beta fold hydrolase [Nanoarchaeota archaeon]
MLKISKQGSFFIGRFPDRMYVQFQVPQKVRHPEPIIMIPGGAHTGACYESTPDGRAGWKDYFLKKGFRIYVPDWPGTGRSGSHPHFCTLSGTIMVNLLIELLEKLKPICPAILLTHSMSGAYGWKVAEKVPQLVSKIVAIAPGPPGNIMSNSKEKFFKNIREPVIINREEAKSVWANARRFPDPHFEEYFNSLAALSPHLANERVNYKDSQLRINPRQLPLVKILIVTGDSDPRHSKEADKSIVAFFRRHYIKAEHYWLPDFGITGNGHLLMIERNNLDIAELIYRWLQEK